MTRRVVTDNEKTAAFSAQVYKVSLKLIWQPLTAADLYNNTTGTEIKAANTYPFKKN
jgi:hypothetical protein